MPKTHSLKLTYAEWDILGKAFAKERDGLVAAATSAKQNEEIWRHHVETYEKLAIKFEELRHKHWTAD